MKVKVELSRDTNKMMKSNFQSSDDPGTIGEPTDTAILVLNTKPFEAKSLIFDITGLFLDLN